jgi:glycosyltransferase involved in cell wall biosynthesis
MLRRLNGQQRRILMTVDAVGGVWQYALGLARQLVDGGDTVVIAGLGPEPSEEQARKAMAISKLYWLKTPPDWLTRHEPDLDGLQAELVPLLRDHAIDMLHLNAPSQAAGLDVPCPVVTVSHSCVASWFRAVKSSPAPDEWAWQGERNRRGFDRADFVVAPSAAHAASLEACYGPIPRIAVVHNATSGPLPAEDREEIILAAGRWWDEGKNAAVLDEAAGHIGKPVFAAGPTSGPNGTSFRFRNAVQLGELPHRDTRRLMARAQLFVSPSLYEPFGLAALEAASAGTPLVLADIPTYRELWGDAALFFPPRNSRLLAAAVDQLMDSPRRWERLSLAALNRSRQFTMERQAAAMHSVYDCAAAIHAEAG